MKKVLLAALLLCGVYSAQAIKIIHGPYLQAVTDTEATIMWVTDVDALSWVEVAPEDGKHFYYRERARFYHTVMGRRAIGTIHQVRVTGLEPGKKYRYAIASREVLSQKGKIHYGSVVSTNVYRKGPQIIPTLNPKKESIEFVVMNDVHAKNEKMEAYLTHCFKKGETDFVVFNGDMVSSIPSAEILYKGFLDTAVKHFASDVPFYYVRGNHETRGLYAVEYLKHFPTTTGKPYYTFTHGNTFFIMLDGGEDKPDSSLEYYETAAYDGYRKEVAEWLKKVVESEECKQAKHRIVCLHMPPVEGHKMWHGTRQIQEMYLPLLNKANISVMLCGHVHKYSYHTDQAAFPIVVNSFEDALKVKIDSNGIKVDVVDMMGAVKHTHSFR
ncbi:MAG: metallophosphoesterase family protein [Alistipes sp.]|nr:metallophosphoesterase family protein [Alistipes sp.]